MTWSKSASLRIGRRITPSVGRSCLRRGAVTASMMKTIRMTARPMPMQLDGAPIGTTRLDVRDDGTAIFRLVAITASEQGRGHGRAMGQLVEERARGFGVRTLFVNAADTAVGFYHATGWRDYVWDQAELDSFAKGCTQMRKAIDM